LSLDWARLLQALSKRCAISTAQRIAAELPDCAGKDEARASLRAVSEGLRLLEDGETLPLGGIEEIRPVIAAARKGELLSGPDLQAVGRTLEGFGRLHRGAQTLADKAETLWGHAQAVHPLPDLAAWLLASFDARGELSAATYPQLQSLRGRKAHLHAAIRLRLDALRADTRFDTALQDDFATLRNDRYVLPVKTEARKHGLGIVHDTSGSGHTVYVEPFEIIELNNDLKMADAELRHEEERILRMLGERLARVGFDIDQSMEAAVALDLLWARARLGADMAGVAPQIVDEPTLVLHGARHPLLVLRGIEVVPNDLRLGGDTRALVLSGPNTGGKTVALKTLGLAALQARAALPVAAVAAKVGWFDAVLTDIGDNQDVEGDLSTFSSHVLTIREMLACLSKDATALLLLDEIAAGTDPIQGAALGRAVLEAMIGKGALVATTTHYPELKALAAADPRFSNGRMEFDPSTGRPTYRLQAGRPGSSHAIEVAEKLGLEKELLDRARSLLDPGAASLEDLLSRLEGEAVRARQERERAEVARRDAERERGEALKQRREAEQKSRDAAREVRANFEREVEGYRATVRGALRAAREAGDAASIEHARQRIIDGAHAARAKLPASDDAKDSVDLDVGGRVFVKSIGRDATVVQVPDGRGRVQVDLGGIATQVHRDDLGPPGGKPASKGPEAARTKPPSHAPAPSRAQSETLSSAFRAQDNTVDVRGQRVDEAIFAVDAYLDEAALRGRGFVFVLHGHGTGVLRDALRRHLRSSPYAAEVAMASREQGGDGVTAVRLR
jgi:DNA mismatch repair protein MutS2